MDYGSTGFAGFLGSWKPVETWKGNFTTLSKVRAPAGLNDARPCRQVSTKRDIGSQVRRFLVSTQSPPTWSLDTMMNLITVIIPPSQHVWQDLKFFLILSFARIWWIWRVWTNVWFDYLWCFVGWFFLGLYFPLFFFSFLRRPSPFNLVLCHRW